MIYSFGLFLRICVFCEDLKANLDKFCHYRLVIEKATNNIFIFKKHLFYIMVV
jgi:hypothetical protein